MTKPKISLVVGNGFSMSFAAYTGLAKKWNSQEPLQWAIQCPSTGGNFLDSLVRLKALCKKNEQLSSFEIFKLALDVDYCESIGIDSFKATLEARHFLTIAFSEYSKLQNANINEGWNWYKWIQLHKDNINGAFSLNYDLLLEAVFDKVRKGYYSLQVNHHDFGIPLVKPHGSVDFEMADGTISYPAAYPLLNFVDLNDTPIKRLDLEDLIYARGQAQCIIPNEANKYSDYQWVKPANDWLSENLVEADYCIFIGISYFDCDKPEIDHVINQLRDDCVIIVANPNPPEDFLKMIQARPMIIWSSYDGPVDSSGKIVPLKCLKTGKPLAKCFCRSGLSYQHCPCH